MENILIMYSVSISLSHKLRKKSSYKYLKLLFYLLNVRHLAKTLCIIYLWDPFFISFCRISHFVGITCTLCTGLFMSEPVPLFILFSLFFSLMLSKVPKELSGLFCSLYFVFLLPILGFCIWGELAYLRVCCIVMVIWLAKTSGPY